MFDEIYWYGRYKTAELAVKKLLRDYEFSSVLDIGCGGGAARRYICKSGKKGKCM